MRRANQTGLCLLAFFSLLACTEKKSQVQDSTSLISGRVFVAGKAEPLTNAEIVLPDGTTTKTDDSGRFSGRTKAEVAGPVKSVRDGYAPVSKEAPKGDGYLELYAKGYDAKAEVEPTKGGKVEVKDNGAAIEVKEKSIVAKEGATPKNVVIEVAVPDPRKATDLPSIPGDFDAKKEGKAGKVSAESPMYIEVRGKEKEQSFELDKEMKASAKFPVRRADLADKTTLFHFNEKKQEWEARGEAKRTKNKAVAPTYEAEIDELGWWTVGEFYDRLTCLRACVEDKNGERVPFARALATGVDHFTQVSAYAAEDGCFALDVRASAQVSLLVQAIDGYVPASIVMTPSKVATVADDPKQCKDLGVLTLKAAEASSVCPLGLRACGESCVDVRSDTENCGGCGNACGGAEGRELSCIDGVCACPFGFSQCTGDGAPAGQGGAAPSTPAGSDVPPDTTGSRDGGTPPAEPTPPPAGSGEPADAGTRTTAAPGAQSATYCANRASDEQNCGGCGIVCAANELCSNGSCTVLDGQPNTGSLMDPVRDAGVEAPASCLPLNTGATPECDRCMAEQCCPMCTGECPALVSCAITNCKVDLETCDLRQVCPREATDAALAGLNRFFNECVYTTCRGPCSQMGSNSGSDGGTSAPPCRQIAGPAPDACTQGQDVCLGSSVTYQCDVNNIAALYTYQISPAPDAGLCQVSCLLDGKPIDGKSCPYGKNTCGDPTVGTVPCDPGCGFPSYVPVPTFGAAAQVPGNQAPTLMSCGGTATSEITCDRSPAGEGLCCRQGDAGAAYCGSVSCNAGDNEQFVCDGNEDCTGSVCCLVIESNLQYAACAANGCNNIDTTGVAYPMCHTDADCAAGARCQNDTTFPFWGVCR